MTRDENSFVPILKGILVLWVARAAIREWAKLPAEMCERQAASAEGDGGT